MLRTIRISQSKLVFSIITIFDFLTLNIMGYLILPSGYETDMERLRTEKGLYLL